jgi:hypothetical protein
LKGQSRSLLSGDMLDGLMPPWSFDGSSGSAFKREDDLADSHLLAFFDFDFAHNPADARWNFDDGLIGLQFHNRLAFRNPGAGGNHEPNQVAGINVLPQFRQPEVAA